MAGINNDFRDKIALTSRPEHPGSPSKPVGP